MIESSHMPPANTALARKLCDAQSHLRSELSSATLGKTSLRVLPPLSSWFAINDKPAGSGMEYESANTGTELQANNATDKRPRSKDLAPNAAPRF